MSGFLLLLVVGVVAGAHGGSWHQTDLGPVLGEVRSSMDTVAKVFLHHRLQIFRAVRQVIE